MEKKVFVMMGRFNPFTKGHEFLIRETIKQLNDEDHLFLFLSRKEDSESNPLSPHVRGMIIRTLFKNESRLHIRKCTENMKCLMDVMKNVDTLADNIVFITGSDHKEEYEILLNKYNNVEYNFNSIEVVVFGNRDSADFIQSMSATKARNFVRLNDFENFSECLPDRFLPKLKEKLFSIIKTRLDGTLSETSDEDVADMLNAIGLYDINDEDPDSYEDDHITLKI